MPGTRLIQNVSVLYYKSLVCHLSVPVLKPMRMVGFASGIPCTKIPWNVFRISTAALVASSTGQDTVLP